jgi:hypothetical protein
MFLRGSSVPHCSWILAGLGLRTAQDMGAHRRETYNSVPTPEDESLKRAFWFAAPLNDYGGQRLTTYISQGAYSARPRD